MNSFNKILLIITLILVVTLAVITVKYFDMRKIAKKNFEYRADIANKLVQINDIPNSRRLINDIKAVEDSKEREMLIKVYLKNGNLTENVAKDLY